MKKYIDYINNFQEGNEYGIFFINKFKDELEKYSQTDIEHILDYVYATKKKFKSIGIKTILEKANKWSEKLQKQASKKDDEAEGIDYETVLDFKDGFKFVKLISENAYEREGKLMSHCVASYYGRDVNIYSLRDSKNMPHCTIEENNQVKGKGNQTVDNKYFGYCIKFLDYMGFSIGENEMKNIGYYNLDNIDNNLTCDEKYLYDGKYISDKNLDKIKDKNGNQYKGFGLLNIKPLFELKQDMKVKFNFDINEIKNYFINSIKELVGGYSSQLVGLDRSQLVGGNSSQLVGGYSSQLVGLDRSQLVGGYSSQLVGGDRSQLVGLDRSQLVGGNSSQLVGGDRSQLVGGNSSQLVGGYSSQLILNGKNSIAVGGHGSKGKGVIGSVIVLCENNKEGDISKVEVIKIDGKKYKENTSYKLEGGKIIEIN